MKTYVGTILDGEYLVHVHEPGRRARPLRWRLDLRNHSPTGFCWGYGGSGPAQLALALLADALHNNARAERLHQYFKWRRIATLPREQEWRMTLDEVLAIVRDLEREQPMKHGEIV